MSVDLLIEIGTEEIPAGFMPPALADLARHVGERIVHLVQIGLGNDVE